MSEARILIVVATLGQRIDFLRQTLESIRSQSLPSDVVIVAPLGIDAVVALAQEFATGLVPDPGSLTSAINLGMAEARLRQLAERRRPARAGLARSHGQRTR